MIRKFTKKDINCVSSLIERYLGVLHDHEYNEEATIKTLDYELVHVYKNYFMDIQDEQIYKISDLVYFPELEKIDV